MLLLERDYLRTVDVETAKIVVDVLRRRTALCSDLCESSNGGSLIEWVAKLNVPEDTLLSPIKWLVDKMALQPITTTDLIWWRFVFSGAAAALEWLCAEVAAELESEGPS